MESIHKLEELLEQGYKPTGKTFFIFANPMDAQGKPFNFNLKKDESEISIQFLEADISQIKQLMSAYNMSDLAEKIF